jgi:hypothetical protein
MNKKLGYSTFYLILVFTWRTGSIFVQVVIPWFRHYTLIYLEFYKYWYSPKFKAKSEKKRLNHGKDPRHRYDTNGHIRKSRHMVRFRG